MYKFLANTVFLGKDIIYLTDCHSTNDLAKEKIKNKEVAEGSLIITDNQFSGRGQRGNSWISDNGKNLTFSLILQPEFLPPSLQFNLNIAIAVGIQEVLNTIIPNIKIKWPNDIVHPEFGKIGGILIENFIGRKGLEYSVVGIGINVNQTVFSLPNAVSLASISGLYFEREDILDKLIRSIEEKYMHLKKRSVNDLKEFYLQSLFQFKAWKTYQDEEIFLGQIVGIDEFGKLMIQKENGSISAYSFKEVKFL